MKKKNLNEPAIARAKADAEAAGTRLELTDESHPGLRLLITPPSRLNPTTRAIWYLACRDRMGKLRRFALGEYGARSPKLGLADARDAARELRVKVRNEGADPIRDRQRDRAIGRDAAAGVGTLKSVLEIYERGRDAKKSKSWPESRKRVELVFAKLLERPVADMTARDFQAEADAYRFKQSASFAVRTIRPALKWLAQRGHVPTGCAAILQPVAASIRERWLSHAELSKLLPVLEATATPHARMVRFLLYTLARRNEAGQARWCDISWKDATWTIPITKNSKVHIVPLPKQAVALLKPHKPDDEKSEALIFASRNGTALGGWDRWLKAIQVKTEVASFCCHDLRRTGATMLGDLGYTPDITEAALNHTVIRSSLSSRYNQSRYRPQVAIALQALADKLDTISAPATPKRKPKTERKSRKSAPGAAALVA